MSVKASAQDREADSIAVTVERALGGASVDSDGVIFRVTAAAQDSEGRLFVLDQSAQQVVVFSAIGEYETRIGSPGNGPGELGTGSAGLLVQDSSVIVFDVGRGSLQFFSKDGRYIRHLRLAATSGVTLGWSASEDPNVALQSIQLVEAGDSTGKAQVSILRRSLVTGAIIDTVVSKWIKSPVRIADGIPHFTLFTPELSWATFSDGSIAISTGDKCQVEIVASGLAPRTIKRECRASRTSDAERDAAAKLFAEGLRMQRAPDALAQTLVRRLRYEAEHPVIISLLATGDTLFLERGDLTAQTFLRQSPAMQVRYRRSTTWDVVTARGTSLGVVQFPVGIVPIQIRGNRVLALYETEDGIEQVVLLRLH